MASTMAAPVAWLGLLLAGAAPAAAGAPSAPTLQDVAVLAGTCFTCHGPDGRAPGGMADGIPGLRGRPAELLLQRMHAFKAGTAPDATVMHLLMQGFDDAQMEALARWFARPEGP